MNRNTPTITKQKLWIITGVILGIILLSTLGFFLFTNGKVLVDVEYAPFAGTVKLNGTTVMNHHGNYITPGEYQMTVEYDNFNTFSATVLITEDTKYLYGKLIPANDTGKAYMDAHNDEFLAVEGIAGQIAADAGLRQREQYPIINQLPVKDPYYTIGYNFTEDGTLNLTVDASISYRPLAVQKVVELLGGTGAAQYSVEFYDLNSPYAGKFVENSESDPAKYLSQGYSGIGVDFTVGGGTVQDEYYYAYLRYFYRDYVGVVYRVVLRSTDHGWQLVADPYPVLTSHNTPGVPVEILNKANSL